MKKLIALTAVLVSASALMTSCSMPNVGKIEIVNTPAPVEAEAGDTAAEGASEENTVLSPETTSSAEEAAVSSSEDQVQAAPASSEEDAGGKAGFSAASEQIPESSSQQYADLIQCRPTMISGNNMIIEVQNENEVPIPMVTVHVHYPDQEKSYNFYQFAPGGTIIVPVEKGDGDLPPAVTADISVSMDTGTRMDLSKDIAVSESLTDTAYTLTLTNNSGFACQNISVTALFANDSGIVYAQMASANETILSGKSTQITIPFPETMLNQGITFTKASYCINEAIG